MGIPLEIYNLYELVGGSERYLLVKAERPEFPNWSESAKDAAVDATESQFTQILAAQKARLGFTETKLLGTWEDAYPEGDLFYSDQSDIPLDVWIATDTKYNRYFVFGIAKSEEEFWNALSELHADGDLWGFEEFTRPAKCERVWFVQ